MRPIVRFLAFTAALGCLAASASPCAATLRITLRADGQPVEDAVVELIDPAAGAPTPRPAVMDQINTAFVPRQLVVTRGSRVSFPNSDTTRHQVYSFSPVKRFELPLYSGTPPEPVVFEQAGVVTLGCNIHDAMIGFIVVVDTDRWATSDGGGDVAFADLSPGRYTLRVWHERAAEGAQTRSVTLEGEGDTRVDIEMTLSPPPPPRGSDRLRALQSRLRERVRDPA